MGSDEFALNRSLSDLGRCGIRHMLIQRAFRFRIKT